MSIRRVRGSFRSSRRFGTVETTKKQAHSSWIFRENQWILAYDDGDEYGLVFQKREFSESFLALKMKPVPSSNNASNNALGSTDPVGDPLIGFSEAKQTSETISQPSTSNHEHERSELGRSDQCVSPKGQGSRIVSPSRGRRIVEPLVEEDAGSEENIVNRSTRSGSVDAITTGFPKFKRSSLHYAHGTHGRKLTRRSSFLVEAACSHPHMNVLPKPIEPIPQPVVVQKRRCSLTLPYPNLYGSWQAAAATGVVKSTSNELAIPKPPLLKQRSLAQFDMSRMHSSHRPNFAELKRARSKGQQLTVSPEADEDAATVSESTETTKALEISATPDDTAVFLQEPIIDENYLISSHLQKIPMKDFGSEVRAKLDVAHFLNEVVLLLDVYDNSLEHLVDAMILKLIRVADLVGVNHEEIKTAIFTTDSVNLLSRTIQGINSSEEYDESWLVCTCNLPTLQKRYVAISRLRSPANFSRTCHDVRFFILILCPSKQKGTKNALETGRTFATIFSDMEFRRNLLDATTEEEFKRLILQQAQNLSQQQTCVVESRVPSGTSPDETYEYEKEKWISFCNGIRDDLARRIPHYISDYRDGIVGYKTIQKTISTTFFLYFACILPGIAFGVLNDHITEGIIDVKKVIVGQTLGELFYAILCGQPLNILLTTAPLCLFVKIIYGLSTDFGINFQALYCCVGLWSSFFTILYALFDASRVMKWSTRSTEEIFALFISIAFCVDAFRDTVKNFNDNYICQQTKNATLIRALSNDSDFYTLFNNSFNKVQGYGTTVTETCNREGSILFLLLMLGTLWLGVSLYNFNKTPYLQASKREALSDYALPVAVMVLTFVGAYLFQDIKLEQFKYVDNDVFVLPDFSTLSWTTIFASSGLGFSLSLLIFMDQNITSAMVNNPCNKLKKGPAFHWDLMVVAMINVGCSLFCFPLMHATLPHSPLHMRSLADVEDRIEQGHVYEIIVRVRETRLTGILSHTLIGFSVLILPHLRYIPVAVLDGLFLYMAVTALNGNQMFERITLLFMEQAAYPPNHYIRRVPQRKIHEFTFCQLLQLLVMCIIGFMLPWPYVKMVFPITLFLLLPVRHVLIPKLIDQKYLDALDGEHQ